MSAILLAGRLNSAGHPQVSGPVDLPGTPHEGANPPPNSGAHFLPAIRTNLPVAPPRVPLIVKRNASRRWMDDNGGDWSEYVSGTNAPFSGRTLGWDLPDKDVAIIDTSNLNVRYITGLMNLCLAVAVNPISGELSVVGTDGMNEIRFEPRLRGVFHRVLMARVPPGINLPRVTDLNPHLDYSLATVSEAQRTLSVGDPRGAVWSADGSRLYVSGMGSGNLVVLDAEGLRVGPPIQLGDFPGPTGLALDDARQRLFVFNRFTATVMMLDTATHVLRTTTALYDPTPPQIKAGRRHFYDTHKTSGLGHAACASCHPDGKFDRLAWDLGAPDGLMKMLVPETNFHIDTTTNHFHPMKGPMVTQTLQDIIGHEPLHWRGDRDGIEEFNVTFDALQGSEVVLSATELQELKGFLATISFPPNPFRTVDNTLPTKLRLPGQLTTGWGALPPGRPLPEGNAARGLTLFRDSSGPDCIACHTLPTGLSPHLAFVNNRWRPVPTATNGAARLALIPLNRAGGLPFKASSLRNLPEKLGFDLRSANGRTGFGFLHDGSLDTLPHFLRDGFGIKSDTDAADVIAFLFCLTGSDLPAGDLFSQALPPGVPSRDVPAAVGRQVTVTSRTIPSLLNALFKVATAVPTRVELIAHGRPDAVPRAWLLDASARQFSSSIATDASLSLGDLTARATPEAPITFTAVPRLTGRRYSLDRDEDGVLDGGQIKVPSSGFGQPNSDPPGQRGAPELHAVAERQPGRLQLQWKTRPGVRYVVEIASRIDTIDWQKLTTFVADGTNVVFHPEVREGAAATFYRMGVLP